MKYFKVPIEFKGRQVNRGKKRPFYLVPNELITECECAREGILSFAQLHFPIVEISRLNTHWLFGARFESKY